MCLKNCPGVPRDLPTVGLPKIIDFGRTRGSGSNVLLFQILSYGLELKTLCTEAEFLPLAPTSDGGDVSTFQTIHYCIMFVAFIVENFSVLKSDNPCDTGSVWSSMALYMFSFHIPLSFGGLSIVAQVLHQSVLDHQTQALSVLVLQTLELVSVFLLLRFTTKPQYKPFSFFEDNKLSKERNWLLASALGFAFLVFLVFLTSFLADILIGPKDVNNPILKEILSSGPVSVTACTLVYCIVAPILEETVYRGFLLTHLAWAMEWQQAVVISSAVFSAAHLSGENFLQLFIIGSVLGCSYCWSGKLTTSILIHSFYNALTLLVTCTS